MRNPLASFTEGRQVPYLQTYDRPGDAVFVFPVIPTAPLAVGRRGAIAHYPVTAAGYIRDGKLRYGARHLCYGSTPNAIFLGDLGAYIMCPKCERSVKPTVYRCFDAAVRLLYVGCSGRWGARRAAHERQTPWWPEVADIQLQCFASMAEALPAEARAIKAENPVYNRAHKILQTA